MSTDSTVNRLEIAKRIKEARKNAKLTQSEVAEALQLTPQAISNYERGANNVPARVLYAMARLYGVRESSFLEPLPEEYNLIRPSLNPIQLEYLQYGNELTTTLREALEFERRGIIQEKMNEISPNELELFLAEKALNGLPVEKRLFFTIIDALLEHPPARQTYIRIIKVFELLCAYEKIKIGEDF